MGCFMKIELIPKVNIVETSEMFWDNFQNCVETREKAVPNGLYGHYLPGDRFYFGVKDEPYIRNSFKTVIYGKVSKTEIKYRYGKDPLCCLLMIIMFLFAAIGSIHLPVTSYIEHLGTLFVFLWIPSHIYSDNVMDRLYREMLNMNQSEKTIENR